MYSNAGIYKQTKDKQQKNIPGYTNTRQHLNWSNISPTGASHSHLHITQIKEKGKEKGVATSLFASSLCLAAGVSRAS